MGNWTHGENVNGAVLDALKLEWFDTWLRGEYTGMADTRTPLHLFENNAGQWVDTAAWPPSSSASTYYLGANSLSTSRPSGQGADTLTYTTAPLSRAVVLDGPSDATIYATSTAPDTEITATLNVIAPDGTVTKQADDVLLGSQRRVDQRTSLYGSGHVLLQADHPFTKAGQQPVGPGQITRYDISLLANFTEIPAGYRIQLVLNSQPPANFHTVLTPTPQELANLSGGSYTIERSSRAASFIDLPLASPSQFTASPVNWGPSS